MTRLRAISILIVGCLIGSCTTVVSRDGAQEELLRADREWSAVAAEGKDVERIVSFWTDDAMIIPAGAPAVRGKSAIRNYVEQSLAVPGFRISWRPEQASLSSDGTMGYTVGANAVTFPGSDGKLVTVEGRYVTVWRNADGQWKCVTDIWNFPT